MARPPLPLGQHGAISVTSNNGRWIARCRVRGLDGVTRKIERSGKSRTAARLALQDELRSQRGERAEVLRPESRFRDAVTIYLGKVTARREDSTTDVYSYWLEKLVLPQLGELRLGECDVAQMDAFFARLERGRRVVEHKDGTTSAQPLYAANTRRIHRAVVAGVLQQAVLHKAIPSNPVRELERIESPKGHRKATPRGLTAEERRPAAPGVLDGHPSCGTQGQQLTIIAEVAGRLTCSVRRTALLPRRARRRARRLARPGPSLAGSRPCGRGARPIRACCRARTAGRPANPAGWRPDGSTVDQG